MMSIMNLPFPGRAGATCQLATLDQLILVGGFDGGLTGPRQFSEPQVAIINTTSWIWTTTFTPASIASKGQNMSIPVIIKIVITSVILLGVISFIAVKYSRKLWRTYELPKGNDSGTLRNSRSREPLMDDNGSREDFMTGSEASSTPMVPFRAHHYQHTRQHQTHSQQLISNPSHNTINLSTVDLGSSAARASSGVSTKREREREPFLIIPYAPNTNSPSMSLPSTTAYSSDHDNSTPMDSGTLFDTGTGTRTSSGSMKSSDFSMISRKSSDSTFSKGYQLSRTLADIQHGQYVKTLQHQKYYEIRRRDLALQRSGTQYTFDGHDVGEDEGQDLATGVIGLREVDVGEESIKGANDGIEDGTILLSSHLDTTALDTRSL
ncbi:hypothetical protein BGZ54_008216 [Gamsiella multidivaricata]|nr:hypothetical protein BGZ54_008216 [Gamsiella multidivaricata]